MEKFDAAGTEEKRILFLCVPVLYLGVAKYILGVLHTKAAERLKSQEIPGLQPCPRSRPRLGPRA